MKGNISFILELIYLIEQSLWHDNAYKNLENKNHKWILWGLSNQQRLPSNWILDSSLPTLDFIMLTWSKVRGQFGSQLFRNSLLWQRWNAPSTPSTAWNTFSKSRIKSSSISKRCRLSKFTQCPLFWLFVEFRSECTSSSLTSIQWLEERIIACRLTCHRLFLPMLHPGKAKLLTKQVKERKRRFSYNKDESTETSERQISGFLGVFFASIHLYSYNLLFSHSEILSRQIRSRDGYRVLT